jgi:hypothetical protein
MTEETNTQKYYFMYKAIFLIAYVILIAITAWGGGGFITDWIIHSGIEFVKVSTFGSMLMGLLGMIGLRWLEYRIDKMFKEHGLGKKSLDLDDE